MENNKLSVRDFNYEEEDEDLLKLTLSTGSRSIEPAQEQYNPPKSSPLGLHTLEVEPTSLPSRPKQFSIPPPPPPPPPPPSYYYLSTPNTSVNRQETVVGPSRQSRTRRSPVQVLKHGKSEIVPQPFTWATTRRATVHSLDYLLSNGINVISGEVQCRRCENKHEIQYDLQQKFVEVASFITNNKCTMHDRAPPIWMNPKLPDCKVCGQGNCAKPILSKKKSINWLFLFLGQMLGCCKLSELKYFCKHTKNHRTGAKDRILYYTYLGLAKQLHPMGVFDI
ncbi:hypothetical protein CFOL_v3_06191 [Cephalotus follicularis]|uniref:DUF7086 domain-containing protein n=1 Tax=Cephalotus follicularis TaxID=3775 RepID=A0A1Q3B3W2_CEPFO|nr:hypothetical protein CFOL_v3_06191 [Cephalotus follicularis]